MFPTQGLCIVYIGFCSFGAGLNLTLADNHFTKGEEIGSGWLHLALTVIGATAAFLCGGMAHNAFTDLHQESLSFDQLLENELIKHENDQLRTHVWHLEAQLRPDPGKPWEDYPSPDPGLSPPKKFAVEVQSPTA